MTTLLIIEDSAAEREETRRVVEAEGIFDRILTAEDGIRGLKLLLEQRPDVVLCDLEMPGMNGDKLLQVRRDREELADVPFLFLTGTENIERRSALLSGGACDAIAKPFHPADLLARLRLHLKVKELAEELRDRNADLERISTTDSLTGLCTRRVADSAIEVEMQRARSHGVPLTVLLADLDDFKQINDRHGHTVGDAVLKSASKLLRRVARATDVVARYGGEEFIAVLPLTEVEGAIALAERWRVSLEAARFQDESGAEFQVTVSVGVAGHWPGLATPEDLIAAADRALYRAKEGGRNCVEVAADSGNEG